MKYNVSNRFMRVPYALSVHDKRETAAVTRVIDEHRTLMGKETAQFENAVAQMFGKKYGVMVNSGSSGNLLALTVLDLPKGSEILTPALTFNTTVAPIIQKGLTPVFVDIKPHAYLVDIDEIERKITKKTRALMIPLLIGNVPDMARLQRIARKHRLFFIEDSCDTLGAQFRGKPTGAYSDISVTSFYGSHIINAAGGGGMICVNNPKWAQRLQVLRGWGRDSALFGETEDIHKRFARNISGIAYDAKFVFSEMGYNFLPLEVSAAFGNVQLQKFPAFARARKRNFAELMRFFAHWPQFFHLPIETPGADTNWLCLPLTIRDGAPFSRKDIMVFLEERGIQTRPVFTGNILRQPAYQHARLAQKPRAFPVADKVMRDAFLIGCHQGLTGKHMKYMERVFKEFLEQFLL